LKSGEVDLPEHRRLAAWMNGPGSSGRRSIARHCDIKTSSCAQSASRRKTSFGRHPTARWATTCQLAHLAALASRRKAGVHHPGNPTAGHQPTAAAPKGKTNREIKRCLVRY
jgi:hypothetical protein